MGEISRVIDALKISPVEILGLKSYFTDADIKKTFRKLSLKVHPDRVPEELKDRAQIAFQKLTNAHESIKQENVRNRLTIKIAEAKRRVNERKCEDDPIKRRKLENGEEIYFHKTKLKQRYKK